MENYIFLKNENEKQNKNQIKTQIQEKNLKSNLNDKKNKILKKYVFVYHDINKNNLLQIIL